MSRREEEEEAGEGSEPGEVGPGQVPGEAGRGGQGAALSSPLGTERRQRRSPPGPSAEPWRPEEGPGAQQRSGAEPRQTEVAAGPGALLSRTARSRRRRAPQPG